MICAVSYILSFYVVYRQRKKMQASAQMTMTQASAQRKKSQASADAAREKKETKLAVAGVILFFLTFCCGISCFSLVCFTFSFETYLLLSGKFFKCPKITQYILLHNGKRIQLRSPTSVMFSAIPFALTSQRADFRARFPKMFLQYRISPETKCRAVGQHSHRS